MDKLGAVCPVCLEAYSKLTVPSILSCGHNVCEGCYDVILDAAGSGTLHCPECRQECDKGPARLNSALQKSIERIMEMRELGLQNLPPPTRSLKA
jgi:hypothetical protein